MKINWSVKFFPYKRRNHFEKGVSIRMRFTLRGEAPVDIATGFIIDVAEWDTEKQEAFEDSPQADEINRTINLWRATISEVMSRYELIEKRIPARGEVKDLFNDLIGRETSTKKRHRRPRRNRIFPLLRFIHRNNGQEESMDEIDF